MPAKTQIHTRKKPQNGLIGRTKMSAVHWRREMSVKNAFSCSNFGFTFGKSTCVPPLYGAGPKKDELKRKGKKPKQAKRN